MHPRDKNGKCLVITNPYAVIVLRQWFPTFFSSSPTFDVTEPQLPRAIYYRSLPQLYQSVRCAKNRSTCLQVSCFRENIDEEQKKGLQVCRCPVFMKILVKSKKCAYRHIFLIMVSHYPPKNHILPLGSNLPPGWEPLF